MIRALTLIGLWLIVTLPFLSRLWISRTSGDIESYWRSAEAVLRGAAIYRDVPFEYPPYVLVWFVGPAAISNTVGDFRLAFGLLVWTLDALVKALLIWMGSRTAGRFDWWPVLLYTVATAAGGHYLLQRYDMIPSVLTLGALLALAWRWPAASGVLLSIAAGTKVYPVILFPVMALVALRLGRGMLTRFLAGGVAAALPLVLLAVWVPWWRFATQHVERGLEAESIWAACVWLLHLAGAPATWYVDRAWLEVRGPLAEMLIAPARLVWVAATVASVAVAAHYAARRSWTMPSSAGTLDRPQQAELAMLLLLPVAAFVATNPVLSPQFHLWMLPLSALMLLTEARSLISPDARHAALCILLSALIVPSFYPTRVFGTGLDLLRTLCLMLRDVLLLYGTIRLWMAVARGPQRDALAGRE